MLIKFYHSLFKRINNSGQSLVSVLVALGISGIVMSGVTSMLATQNKETRALSEKIAAIGFQSLLMSTLADGSICTFELNNPAPLSFDSSTASSIAAASINLNKLHASASPTAPLIAEIGPASPPMPGINSLVISSIKLSKFSGSGTNYTAKIIISFDSNRLVRPLKAIEIPIPISADNTIPTSTKITSCNKSAAQTLTGCIEVLAQIATNRGAFCPANMVSTGWRVPGEQGKMQGDDFIITCCKLGL